MLSFSTNVIRNTTKHFYIFFLILLYLELKLSPPLSSYVLHKHSLHLPGIHTTHQPVGYQPAHSKKQFCFDVTLNHSSTSNSTPLLHLFQSHVLYELSNSPVWSLTHQNSCSITTLSRTTKVRHYIHHLRGIPLVSLFFCLTSSELTLFTVKIIIFIPSSPP